VNRTFWTAAEVAEALQISVHAVYKQVAAGKVAPLRTFDTPLAEMLFTDEDLTRLVRALNPPPPAPARRHLVLVGNA
jgi:predicted site-specific integrase-resolvase